MKNRVPTILQQNDGLWTFCFLAYNAAMYASLITAVVMQNIGFAILSIVLAALLVFYGAIIVFRFRLWPASSWQLLIAFHLQQIVACKTVFTVGAK